MSPKEFQCAICKGTFEYVRNEKWSEQKAEEEYERIFPYESKQSMDRAIVCDDCHTKFLIWLRSFHQ